MAVGGDDEKPKFRCLDAGRYAVALAVAVIVVVVIVHAVATVLRPADLIVRLDEGYVSVKNVSNTRLSFTFTLWARNPSGRVRIYFTDNLANISRPSSSSSSSLEEDDDEFFVCKVDNFMVAQQDAMVVSVTSSPAHLSPDVLNKLSGGGSIGNALLKFSGSRIVENYAGQNDTAKRVVYYCPAITVGGEDPEDAPDVACTDQQPPVSVY